jgi:hypothetical protein
LSWLRSVSCAFFCIGALAAFAQEAPVATRDTLDDFFAVVAFKEGPSYVDARDAILAGAARNRDEYRARLIAIESASTSWENRFASQVLQGWMTQRDDFTLCAIYARGDLTGPKPVPGFTAARRAKAIVALGIGVTPRLLELLIKTDGLRTGDAIEAVVQALVELKDPRAADAMEVMARVKREGRDLREAALRILAALRDRRVLEPAMTIVGNRVEETGTRVSAVHSLTKLPQNEIGPTLLRLAQRTDGADPTTREGVLAALATVRERDVLVRLLLAAGEVATEADLPMLRNFASVVEAEVRPEVEQTMRRIEAREELARIDRDPR